MLRHELLKLATLRWVRRGAVLTCGLSALLALVVAQALTSVADLAAETVSGAASPADLAQTVLRTSAVPGVFGAVVGVLAARGDVGTGVLRTTLVIFPDRTRVLLAKATATALVASLVAALSAVLVLLVVSAVAGAPGAGTWVGGVVAHAAVAALWSVAGVAAGLLLPTAAGGLATVLALPFVLEPAVAGLVTTSVAALLPFRSGGHLYALMGASTTFAPGVGGGVLAAAPFVGLVLAAAAGAAARFRTAAV